MQTIITEGKKQLPDLHRGSQRYGVPQAKHHQAFYLSKQHTQYPPQELNAITSLELDIQGGQKSLPLDPALHARHTVNSSNAKSHFVLSCITARRFGNKQTRNVVYSVLPGSQERQKVLGATEPKV